MSVRIIILNYRTPALTIDCLRSVVAELSAGVAGHVVVVDNASGDDSVPRLQAAIHENHWHPGVHLLPAATNAGFSAGNNLGIKLHLEGQPAPDYTLLLNPDTIVHPGAISALIRFLEQNPSVGIAGSRLENPDGSTQLAARRFPGLLSEFETAIRLGPITRLLSSSIVTPPEPTGPGPCDWLPGASLLIRADVLEQVGLLDEKFFMYYEEVDYCLRTKRAGWQIWYVPQSRVIHLVGQASGVTSRSGETPVQKPLPAYWYRSRARYFTKNHGLLYRLVTDLAWLGGNLLNRIRCILTGRPRNDPPRLIRNFLRHGLAAS